MQEEHDDSDGASGAIPMNSMTILLRYAEHVDPMMFNDLLVILNAEVNSKIGVHLIIVNASSCRLPLPQEGGTHSLFELSLYSTIEPSILYDDVIGFCVTDRNIPIIIPSAVIAWIHESFWRANCCTSSAIDKILLCYHSHFSEIDALLIMFTDIKWLEDMKIVHKSSKRSKLLEFEQYDKVCLLTHSLTHSLTYLRTHSLTHSLTHSPTYLLTNLLH